MGREGGDMEREEHAQQEMKSFVEKNAAKWKEKYGCSWYNEVAVLSAQKRIYQEAWHKAAAAERGKGD